MNTRKLFCKRGHPRTPENVDSTWHCLICANMRALKWSKDNPIKRADVILRHSYGIDTVILAKILKSQNNRCAICHKTFSGKRAVDKPHVDHKHGDKKCVRGLLCHKCNVFISLAFESEKILKAAIEYLKERKGGLKWLKLE